MNRNSKIYVAGHTGLVGQALVRCLQQKGYYNLLLRNRVELDLTDQLAVRDFFANNSPDCVILVAAKVGGILHNLSDQADFLYQNLAIASNTVHAAHQFSTRRLLFLGSSCIYPREAPQPIKEELLLTGPLEPTNEGYAIAKIAGLKMCEKYRSQYGDDFFSIMPTNTYGQHDNFHITNSHVVPGIMSKIHQAKICDLDSVVLWGSGRARREFINVEDLAEAIVLLMEVETAKIFSANEGLSWINVGTGCDVSISDLANTIKGIVGYRGRILFDQTTPDGSPQKLLDIGRISSLGWKPKVLLEEGLMDLYQWALQEGKL